MAALDPKTSRPLLYELFLAGGEQWRLSEQGLEDSGTNAWALTQGQRVDVARELSFPIRTPGPPLDVTFTTMNVVVVTERIGELVAGMAPDDVQLIPARVESREERYAVLNVLSKIDCIDWETTRATVTLPGPPSEVKFGTLASLGDLIDRSFLARHVVGPDMTLKTDGIEGARIFYVEGWADAPIVTGEIKTALEQAGATGLTYKPMRTSTTAGRAGRVARGDHAARPLGEGARARTAEASPVTAVEGWHEAVDAHCERFLGPCQSAIGEIVPTSEYLVTLYPHLPTTERPWITLRTAGVSDHPMAMPPGLERRGRCELLTYLPPDWDLERPEGWWPAALLKLLGQFVHENDTWFGRGHTVLVAEPGETYAPGTLVSAALLRAPTIEPREFGQFESAGEACRFLWAFPVTEAETNLKLEEGESTLVELIEQHRLPHVLDAGRPCLVTGMRP